MNRPIKLLYLEDNGPERQAFFWMVADKELPYEITAAETVTEARRQLEQFRFDIVVADYHLPDGNATELFEDAKGIPFILLTGTLEENLALRTLEGGADDYLPKDADYRHLQALPISVEKTLHRQRLHETEHRLSRELVQQNEQLTASREMLDTQRRRYQELFDLAPNGYLVTDLYGLISDANLAACKMLKQTRDLLLGAPLNRFLASRDRRKTMDLLLRFREGICEPVEHAEFMLHPKGAALTPCSVTINAIIAEGGAIEGLRWLFADISAQKEAERQLRESEQRFRAIFEKAVVGIIEVDKGGRFVAANEQFSRILGFNREETLGKTVREVTFPEDRPRIDELIRALQDGRVDSVTADKRCLTREGSPLWTHATLSAIRDGEGRFLYSIGTVEDINERKLAEERIQRLNQELKQRNAELAAERERWQGVVEGIADEVWICDVQGRTSLMNIPSLPLMGLIEYVDTSIDDLLQEVEILNADGTQRRKHDSPMIRSLQGEILRGEEILRHRKTGKICYRQFSSAPTRDATGAITGAVAIVRDITELKRMEQELKAAKESAEQASHAKDHFLAVLSHELRTPLTPVVMALSMLRDRQELAVDVQEILEMVHRNIDLEARLIDDLLDITRIARGKIELRKQRLELRTVINRAVEVCKPDMESRDLHFGVDFGPFDAYWIEADVSRLEQVFWNLLKNAVKFTPHGGCVSMRCKPIAGQVIIDVTDSGVGIEAEALSRIFNAFEQAEQSITRQFGGLGLGLAITKALVELHGGSIEAYSEGKGTGATFRVRLPLAVPAVAPTELASAAPALKMVQPLRILLVEDHGVTAKIIQAVLNAEGHTVERAGDMATALRLAANENFDLLISDLGLPDGSGHDLMRQLRIRGHRFPAIALSGYGQEEDIKHSYQAGFAAHLIKPASREAVVDTIAGVIGGEQTALVEDSSTTLPIDTTVFNVEAALKQCFGERELLAQMIQFFFEDYETLLPQIRSALKRGDLHELGKLGHRLKGTILHLGAEHAEEAAADVERAGLYGDEPADAEEAVRWMERECQVLKTALTEYKSTCMSVQA